MTRFEIIRDKLKEVFTMCPLCKGRGGEREAVLDYGLGPWYECNICNGHGYINVFKKIYWRIQFYIWEKQEKAHKKRR